MSGSFNFSHSKLDETCHVFWSFVKLPLVCLCMRNVFIGKQIGTYNLDIWVMVIG
jgi:hypothetical protein